MKITNRERSALFEALEPRLLLSSAWSAQAEELIAAVTKGGCTAPVYVPELPVGVLDDGGPAPCSGESTELINMDDLWGSFLFEDLRGAGYAVAVIDTGADLDHPFFGADQDENGVADRIVFQYDFGGDNDPDASDTNGHGSNVASIIGSEDDTYPGVAPEVNLVILKVLPGGWDDVEEALQWLVNNAEAYNIVSVNMSIGDFQNWTEPVSPYDVGDELAALWAMGIVPVAASGNQFYVEDSTQGVSYPAADIHSLSIGAVYDANVGIQGYTDGSLAYTTAPDRVCPFSQRHEEMTTCFAPGAPITGANWNGGIVTKHGTSQAAPHVSGLVAVMQQLAERDIGRRLSVEEFVDLLVSTGVTINDGDDEDDNVTNTDLDFPRVDALAMAEALAAKAMVAEDDLETGTTSGGSGWSEDWALTGHADVDDSSAARHSGSYGLLLNGGDPEDENPDNWPGVAVRETDMSGRDNGRLTFWWKGREFESGDWAEVQVYDGSSHSVLTVVNGQDDNQWHQAQIDLTGYEMTDDFRIQVVSHMNGPQHDYFYVDDIRFSGGEVSAAPTGVDLITDTGQYADDDVTKAYNSVEFQVSGTVEGALVVLYDGETEIGSGVGNGGTLTITTVASYDFPEGERTITAIQREAYKLDSPACNSLTVYVDRTAPTGSVPDLLAADDTGKLDDDEVTKGLTPHFDGTASDPGSGYTSGLWKVVVASDDGKSGTDESTPATYGVELGTLNEGERTVTATVYDVAGNSWTTAELTLTVDRTAPSVNVNPLATADQTPPLTGTIDDNEAEVVLTVDGNEYDDVTVESGAWSLPDNKISTLAQGYPYDVSAVATDVAGNVGFDSSSDELIIMIPGDGNEDCNVDGADYTIWSDHYLWTGQSPWSQGGWTVGNFNEDDTVNGADYTIWSSNYGWHGGGGEGGKGKQSRDADTGAIVDELDREGEPSVTYRVVDLGDGLYGYTFTLHGNDETYASFFADVTFEAEEGCTIIQQKVVFGHVQWDGDFEYYAEIYDGMGDPPYDMDRDSWFGDAFGRTPPAGIMDLEQTETTYHIESGTGGGSEYLDVKLAYIVSDGSVTLTALIARLGVNYEIELVATPEGQ